MSYTVEEEVYGNKRPIYAEGTVMYSSHSDQGRGSWYMRSYTEEVIGERVGCPMSSMLNLWHDHINNYKSEAFFRYERLGFNEHKDEVWNVILCKPVGENLDDK